MRTASRILTVLGTLALLAGLISGAADRQLLDTPRFLDHADAIRQDPAVARELSVEISDRLIALEPDLVAVRPLLEGTLATAIQSPAFRSAFRTAVEPLHLAWTGSAPSTLVLRVADIGAVVVAVTRATLPGVSERLPADIEVRLARFGSGSAARTAVGAVRWVRVLAWLCPLIALGCFIGVVALARGRRRAALDGVGLAILATGLGLALATVVTTFAVARLAPESLGGALTEAAWRELAPAVRNTGLVAGAVGYLVMVAASLSPADTGMGALRDWREALRWRSLAAHAPVGTAIAVVVVGALLVTEPVAMLSVVAITLGLALGLHGLLALVAVLAPRVQAVAARRRASTQTASQRPMLIPVVGLALLLLAGLIVWNTRAVTTPLLTAARDTTTCNGSVELCGRRYDQVAFPATHNSMAAADEPGWFLAEQPDGVMAQLDAGVTAFLIDAWDAQPTERHGVVANTDATNARALAQAEADLGADVVRSALRVRDRAGLTPSGPVRPYLCHALCVLGATRWEPLMVEVRGWLERHPRVVVTFVVQDELPAAQVVRVFQDAGLLPMVYTPDASGTWPTLEQMIDSGHRVVVMAENGSGGAKDPWLMPAFKVMQDTRYDARRVSDFTCTRNRGPATASLFMVNHWLNQPLRRVRASRLANSDGVLGKRLTMCERQRQLPNFVAVDFYNQGDLFGQVRRLNHLDGGPS